MAGLVTATMVLTEPLAAGASSAHAPRRMPDVVGLPRAEVYAAMRHAGLYFTTRGPGAAAGTWKSAAGQRPRAGARVAWHATVVVTTSRQSGHALRRVPRLRGLTRAQVYAAMRRARLFFTTRGAGSASGRWVVAVGQSPRAGTRVRWHSSVVVTTSTHRPAPKRKVSHPTTTTVRHRVTTTTTRATTTSSSTTTTTSAVSTTTYPGETTTTTTPDTTTSSTTTTLRRPTTTTTRKPRPKPVRYRIGLATWYSYFPGRCATSYLPMGTRIWVRNLATGRTITCVVTDRQGSTTGRVADLSETQFAELAPLARGIVRVKVWW